MNEIKPHNLFNRKPCWGNIVLFAFLGLLVLSLCLPAFEQVSAQAVSISLVNLSTKSVEDSAYTIVIGLLATSLLLGLVWLFFQRRFPNTAH